MYLAKNLSFFFCIKNKICDTKTSNIIISKTLIELEGKFRWHFDIRGVLDVLHC